MEQFSVYRGPSLSCWNRNKKDKQQILTDKDLIQSNIKNILLTNMKERIYNFNFGCNLIKYLFSIISFNESRDLQLQIIKNLKFYEPRIDKISVEVEPLYPPFSTRGGYNIKIYYTIKMDSTNQVNFYSFVFNPEKVYLKISPFI